MKKHVKPQSQVEAPPWFPSSSLGNQNGKSNPKSNGPDLLKEAGPFAINY
jgi:hypothetical protein